MNITTNSIAKSKGKNEVVISFDLFPSNVAPYSSVDWTTVFEQFSHAMSPSSASLDEDGSRLRVTFAYS